MKEYNPFDLGTPIPNGYELTNANTTIKGGKGKDKWEATPLEDWELREILFDFWVEMRARREEDSRDDCIEQTVNKLSALTKETVICSAIKLEDGRVLRCHRHGDGILNAHHNGWKLAKGTEQQGFITSRNRYVSREDGRKLQDEAGIKSADKDGYRGKILFSEDLY